MTRKYTIPMKLIFNNIIAATLILGLFSCEDRWDKHYSTDGKTDVSSGKSVMQIIQDEPDFSTFSSLIESDIEEQLANSFDKTLFIPKNDAFVDTDLSTIDTTLWVKSFIAWGYFAEDMLKDTKLTMMTGKNVFFKKDSTGISLDNQTYISEDYEPQIATSGLVYAIDSLLDIKPNLYQQLSRLPLYADYFDKSTVLIFDEENSTETGDFTDDGLSIYDTVWVEENLFLKDVADIAYENNIYTMIVPTEEKVNEVLENDVAPYFGNDPALIPDDIYVKVMNQLMESAIFKGLYYKADLKAYLKSIFYRNVPVLFGLHLTENQDIVCSNGIIHETKQAYFDVNNLFFNYEVANMSKEIDSLDWKVSEDHLMYGKNGEWITTFQGEKEGDWVEFNMGEVLSTTYEIWFAPKVINDVYIQVSFGGINVGQPFTVNEEIFNAEGTPHIPVKIGEVTLTDFGESALRFTLLGPGSDGYTLNLRAFKINTKKK